MSYLGLLMLVIVVILGYWLVSAIDDFKNHHEKK